MEARLVAAGQGPCLRKVWLELSQPLFGDTTVICARRAAVSAAFFIPFGGELSAIETQSESELWAIPHSYSSTASRGIRTSLAPSRKCRKEFVLHRLRTCRSEQSQRSARSLGRKAGLQRRVTSSSSIFPNVFRQTRLPLIDIQDR